MNGRWSVHRRPSTGMSQERPRPSPPPPNAVFSTFSGSSAIPATIRPCFPLTNSTIWGSHLDLGRIRAGPKGCSVCRRISSAALAPTLMARRSYGLKTLQEWLDHYASVTSSPPDHMLGTLDPALAPVEITPQEKQELIDFLLSLSSAYASAWTQKP